MTDLRRLIEEIDELVDKVEETSEDEMEEGLDDNMFDEVVDPLEHDNTTELLNAKTKISRALDVLKDAINDFKTMVVTQIDLIEDAELSAQMEALDKVIMDMSNTLVSEPVQPNDFEEDGFEDAENTEDSEETDSEKTDREETDREEIEQEPEEDEEEPKEVPFDDEASIDLFNPDKKEEK